jgi:hypothetical protein
MVVLALPEQTVYTYHRFIRVITLVTLTDINNLRKMGCSPLGGNRGVSMFRKEAEYKHLSSFFR